MIVDPANTVHIDGTVDVTFSEFVRRASAEDEERIFERIRAEIARLEGADPDRGERALGPFLADPLENLRFVTPRQRQLIRYAIRPEDCPLLDLAYLGSRPEEPDERRLWDRDYRTLARLKPLSDAWFGREMVLHLAGAGSPEDFLRAIQNLRRPPARK